MWLDGLLSAPVEPTALGTHCFHCLATLWMNSFMLTGSSILIKFLLSLGSRVLLCSPSSFCKLAFGMGKEEYIVSSDVTTVHDDYSNYELMLKNFSSIIKILI